MPRLAGKGRQGTGRTAYGIRGYIRNMKRTKSRIQVDRGTQGRNTKAVNYTHPLDTDVRKGRGDRICEENLQGFGSTCTQSGPSSEGRSDIGPWQGQHRQALHTKVAMTQRQGSWALADEEQLAEAAQPGRKWTGLMKRSRA